MALTFQEKYNLALGLPLTDPVTLPQQIEACVKDYGAKIKTGVSDYTLFPNYAAFSPTASQINEWCDRALDSVSMTIRMIPAIIADPAIEAAGLGATPAEIDAAVQSCICAFAAKL